MPKPSFSTSRRAILAGLASTTSLLAAVAIMAAVLGGIVAYETWPQLPRDGAAPPAQLFIAEQSSAPETLVTPDAGGDGDGDAGDGSGAAAAGAAGAAPAGATPSAPGGGSAPTTGSAPGGSPVPGDTPPTGPSSPGGGGGDGPDGGPPGGTRNVLEPVAAPVQGLTAATGDIVAGTGTVLGAPVSGLNDPLADVVTGTTTALGGTVTGAGLLVADVVRELGEAVSG